MNYSGTEYACIQGWGIFDGPSDAAMINAIASWHANVVHIGLNEDCILGINGVPSQYAGANYMNAITGFVNRLHARGLYAEVSLMWAAPGTQQALDHPPILDQDHSPAAWTAIANAFKRSDDDPRAAVGAARHHVGLLEERRLLLLGRLHRARHAGRAERDPRHRRHERRHRVRHRLRRTTCSSGWRTSRPTR